MKRTRRLVIAAVVLIVAPGFGARRAQAAQLTYGVSGESTSASRPTEAVTFDVSGASVSVTLSPPGPHALTAVFSNSSGNSALAGGGNAEPVFGGNHEMATCDAIAGWVWNPQQPDTPISVSVYADETQVATIVADRFRRDLLDARMGNGNHGFTSPLPASLKDGKPHQIRVIVAGSEYDLANTPKVVRCAPVPNSASSQKGVGAP